MKALLVLALLLHIGDNRLLKKNPTPSPPPPVPSPPPSPNNIVANKTTNKTESPFIQWLQ